MIACFVDIGNLYYCIEKKYPGRKLDYSRYLNQFEDTIVQANAYGTQMQDEAIRFITCLKKLGWNPIFKSIKESKSRVIWDCSITVDVIKLLEKQDIDTIIIGSAKGDLIPLVELIKSKGIKCTVIACGINKELKAAASSWTEIPEDLLEVSKSEACQTA